MYKACGMRSTAFKISIMKKTAQRDTNPYKNSDSNKRYFSYDYYLRKKYGSKVSKVMLDAGFTCPNIDGKCSVGGCIYCSGRGSGDFAGSPLQSITEQIDKGVEMMSKKWSTEKIIPYFQAHTNTYAPVSVLREKFEEALSYPGVVGLNVATRADCLEEDVLLYLAEISDRTSLTVELGLQSANDSTAEIINRGHSFYDFVVGYDKLRKYVPKAEICIHVIHGLPGEDREMMLETIRKVADLDPEQVKIHLLHVVDRTKLANMYKAGEYTPLSKEEYVNIVCDSLELLPPDTVICRLTGDGAPDLLLAPEWSRKKVSVINDVDKELYSRDSYQGKYFSYPK